ncbi:hypothetical protein NQ318_015004 [Aromia moschata]|uniref:Uncharacterized protein n=1 Tax=Aromia moschata TaxID=1265417 RepID=A0AAV8YZR2_9CUCU|nr:hypothetical protein NQ318_015004 [Aromia moschata]
MTQPPCSRPYHRDMELPIKRPEKIKLKEINPYLTCYLCKGIFDRRHHHIGVFTLVGCIIKFLQDNSFCPVCEVIINKAKPNLNSNFVAFNAGTPIGDLYTTPYDFSIVESSSGSRLLSAGSEPPSILL